MQSQSENTSMQAGTNSVEDAACAHTAEIHV